MNANAKAGFSIPEWCAAAGFSAGLYYKRKRLGLTSPHSTKVGDRTIITEAPAEFLKRLEREGDSTSQLGSVA